MNQLHRYSMKIIYIGTNFSGWQKNSNGKTIQETIENALFLIGGKIFKFLLVAAGRTDTGVHSLGQIAHFDSDHEIDMDFFLVHLNSLLKIHPIYIDYIKKENNDFHARFSAKYRIYRYSLTVDRAAVFFNPHCLLIDKHLHSLKRLYHNNNILFDKSLLYDKIKELFSLFIGNHNFFNYSSNEYEGGRFFRTIDDIYFIEENNIFQVFIKSKSFLHHQIRLMVGAVLFSIKKEHTSNFIIESLSEKYNEKNSRLFLPMISSIGLCLYKVGY
jgi:tRNA pseudouridine38-40 synthase